MRNRRNTGAHHTSGDKREEKQQKPNQLLKNLSFQRVLQKREETKDNQNEEEETESENEEDESEEEHTCEVCRNCTKRENQLFCTSLAETLDRLDWRKQRIAKIKFQAILYDLEYDRI